MKVIPGPPKTGKTRKLISFACKYDSTIVCRNNTSRQNVLLKAREMNIKIREPITYDEFMRYKDYEATKKIKIDNVAIDNADYFLSYIAYGLPIRAITIGAYCE